MFDNPFGIHFDCLPIPATTSRSQSAASTPHHLLLQPLHYRELTKELRSFLRLPSDSQWLILSYLRAFTT